MSIKRHPYWAFSSVVVALALHARGRAFDPHIVHFEIRFLSGFIFIRLSIFLAHIECVCVGGFVIPVLSNRQGHYVSLRDKDYASIMIIIYRERLLFCDRESKNKETFAQLTMSEGPLAHRMRVDKRPVAVQRRSRGGTEQNSPQLRAFILKAASPSWKRHSFFGIPVLHGIRWVER